MSKKRSQSRIIKFMLGLWRISPIACSLMGVTQTVCAILTTTIAPIFVSGLLNNIANGTATVDNSIPFLVGYALVCCSEMLLQLEFRLLWHTFPN